MKAHLSSNYTRIYLLEDQDRSDTYTLIGIIFTLFFTLLLDTVATWKSKCICECMYELTMHMLMQFIFEKQSQTLRAMSS